MSNEEKPPGANNLMARVDHVKVFNLFCFFGGDEARTASACGIDVRIVHALAHDFTWNEKRKGRNRLDTDDGLKTEQENNRAANYHMAKQLQAMIAGIVLEASDDPEKWAYVHCIDVDEDGFKTFSPKPLAEIAKAIQITQDMTYRALGDKVAAKAEIAEGSSQGALHNLSLHIYAGLDKMAKATKSVEKVIDVLPALRNATDTDLGVLTSAV